MGNRSRYVVMGAAAMGVASVARARRRRLRHAAEGFVDAVMPSAVSAPPEPVADPLAHAPGHQHVSTPAGADEGSVGAARTFAKHQHGLRHPGRA